jgi:hypothetical protein
MRKRRFAAWLSCVILAPVGAAWPQGSQPGTNASEYKTESSRESVEQAPPGWLGRKTTSRSHLVGIAEATRGSERDVRVVFGGFVRRCPTPGAEYGVAEGTFEYSLSSDEVAAGEGATKGAHEARRFVATLKGHVGDDARLGDVELEGTYTSETSGGDLVTASSSTPVRTTFRPGPSGEPDMNALMDVARQTADLAVSFMVLWAGGTYRDAERAWLMNNECVEFSFDPPTDTRSLGPNETTQVRAELRPKSGGSALPWRSEALDVINGAGEVSPKRPETQTASSVTLTYTASARPRAGHGFRILAPSRGGVAFGEWRIKESEKYQGTFTQTRTMSSTPADAGALASAAARYGVGASATYTITGDLLWTRDPQTRASTFGDVPSTFFVPTDGQIEVEAEGEGRSVAGVCRLKGGKTFPIRDLPPGALQYLLLEVAEDGRYRIWLGMVSSFLQFEMSSQCSGRARRVAQTLAANDAAIVIGQQEGVSTGEVLAGETPAPIVNGSVSYTGTWNFKKVAPPQ